MNILEAKNLTKKFGKFTAVDNISFALKEGEILGILGPNGAGKTTTLQMLLGILNKTSGSVNYFGKNFDTHRQEILEKVNFSSTYTSLPWGFKVRENLKFISYFYEIKDRKKRIAEIVQIFKLEEMLSKQMRDLSAGQTTRVSLAKAFINFPKVLLLDEPTASLDPEVAQYMRDFLLEQRQKYDLSIIITSHNMAEVEEICDRVLFIKDGKILADDTPQNLAKSIKTCHVQLLVSDRQALMDYCKKSELECRKEGKYVIVDVSENEIAKFINNLSKNGITFDEISIEKPTLEDYFLQVAGAKEGA